MEQHETAHQHDDECLNRNGRDKVTVADRYEQNQPEFLKLLESLEDMLDGYLGRTTTVKNRIELTHNYINPIHSAPYRAGPKERQFTATEIDRILRENVTELSTTEWESPSVFSPKKNGSP